jgi:hypothetical protein
MRINQTIRPYFALIIIIGCFISACRLFSGLAPSPALTESSTASPTLTPTIESAGKFTPEPNPCDGLSGSLKLELLIGPSDAVGLEPFTFADIPFVVVREGDSYRVTGGGPIQYYEDVYQAEWGTFSVTFDGETTLGGECISNDETEVLTIDLEMAGEQTIEVVYDGITTTFPWEGTPRMILNFPIEDGAQEQGEGWVVILHLN